MKKIRGELLLYLVIMVAMLTVLALSLQIAYPEAKVLPLVTAGSIFLLAAAGAVREVMAANRRKAAVTGGSTKLEAKEEDWRGYLVNGAWVAGFCMGIFLLGFLITPPLFILAYMRKLGRGWLSAAVFAVVTPILLYGLFERVLQVELYRGAVFYLLGD